jgi:LemA protein
MTPAPENGDFTMMQPLDAPVASRRSRVLSFALVAAWIGLLPGCGYNSLQRLDEEVKAALAEVDNQYQRRSDLVPNLVETVKGYAKHETETLTSVVNARSAATQTRIDASKLSDPAAIRKYQEAQGELTQALSRLLVVVEKYPDLKANENFRDLQAQLEGTENRLAVARKRYTDMVKEYNTAVRSFPTNLTARFLLGLQVREPFSVDASVRQNPAVKF